MTRRRREPSADRSAANHRRVRLIG